ncbi:DUF6542 domain-containing protein [Streptomyces bohaiensis]|uniref:DUF6542 domain-containing protein n=2 Tax=Streptomyces bohaiensis TaxID=1431344 RepID=UPI001FD845AD|nr:DUF6542 domain-containing protein [Streptomyces bohaiensis]
MEYSTSTTRPPLPRPAAGAAGVPRPARAKTPDPQRGRPAPRAREGTARPRPPLLDALARLPRPKLTGLGCGVIAIGSMLVGGWFSRILGGAPVLYGLLFVLVSVAVAAWVRPVDLICAPVAVPIAYAAGLIVSGGLYELFTELAVGAPWLFAGTLAAVGITLGRQVTVMAGRIRRRRENAARAAAAAQQQRG